MKSALFPSRSLAARIESALQPQIESIHGFERLVVVAGNGLTRIAAGMSGGGLSAVSWEQWVAGACKEAGMIQSARYLRHRGYDLASIFHEAVSLVLGERELAVLALDEQIPDFDAEIYQKLARIYTPLAKLYDIRPSPAHRAVGKFANFIVTTNYDNIFEQLGHPWVYDGRVGPHKPEGCGPLVHEKPVQHIHGSFPQDRNKFDLWVHQAGMRRTLADRSMYTAWAYTKTDTDIQNSFGPVLEELGDTYNLVLFIGLSMGAEEMLLERLLRLRVIDGGTAAQLVSLQVAPPLDPLLYLKSRRIKILRVPDGLAAGTHARALVILIALRLLTERWMQPENHKADLREMLDGEVSPLGDDIWPTAAVIQTPLPRTIPLIAAVGQVSLNRVIGIEQTPSQERAYQPKESTWKPGTPDRRPLLSWGAGGQALVPCLVWDALGIPSSLSGIFYDDEVGEQVLDSLDRTNWLDFLGVVQCPAGQELAGSAPLTDNSTVVTWFGQRLIIDSARKTNHDEAVSQYRLAIEALPKDEATKCGQMIQVLKEWPSNISLKPNVIYATKTDWKALRRAITHQRSSDSSWDPLIIYDTGSLGDPEVDMWVASQSGIVIASAFTSLIWYGASTAVLTEDATPTERDFLARWTEVKDRYEEAALKDERGRVWQLRTLLEQIKMAKDPVPDFLRVGPLAGLRAFIVTLGELGCLYWLPTEDGWNGSIPRWCALAGTRDASGQPVVDKEVVSGLGCGDVARAGFVASLLATLGGSACQKRIEARHLEWAIGWANWFGAKKVRFLALKDFIEFLRWEQPTSATPKERNLVKSMACPALFENTARLEDESIFWTDVLSAKNTLTRDLEKWFLELKQLEDPTDRSPWNDRMKKWRKARFLDPQTPGA